MRSLVPSPSASATRRLLRAVKRGDVVGARVAVAQHADVHVRVSFQRTPAEPSVQAPVLFWALRQQDSTLIEALLEARASLDVRVHPKEGDPTATHGFTALDVVQRQEDLLRLLWAVFLLHQPGGSVERDTVLQVAAAQGWAEAIQWVVARSPSVDVRNARGQTPLHAAVRQAAPGLRRSRMLGTIRLLCAAGCRLDSKDGEGRTAVQLALLMCPELLPVLIECGASLDLLTAGQRQRLEDLPEHLRDRMAAAAAFFRLRQRFVISKAMPAS